MLLAIDTSTRTLSLALHDGDTLRAESTWITDGKHTVELAPSIQHLLALAGGSVNDLTLLAVAQGPGSFNGLRAGFSAAKGLSMALDIPLIAVPTLDIVAAAQPPFAGDLICVAQAGRGRVVAASYRWEAHWTGGQDVQILGWGSLLSRLTTAMLFSGEIDRDGLAAIRAAAERGVPVQASSPALALRRAGFLAELALGRWHRGEVVNPDGGTPYYLHQPGVPHP
jgi:tRNA threonylcarbamoyladenosine biosynthesis protein TsaB